MLNVFQPEASHRLHIRTSPCHPRRTRAYAPERRGPAAARGRESRASCPQHPSLFVPSSRAISPGYRGRSQPLPPMPSEAQRTNNESAAPGSRAFGRTDGRTHARTNEVIRDELGLARLSEALDAPTITSSVRPGLHQPRSVRSNSRVGISGCRWLRNTVGTRRLALDAGGELICCLWSLI